MSVRCKTCGQPLASGKLDGLCPACLIGQIGLLDESLVETGDLADEPRALRPATKSEPGKIHLSVPGHLIISELGRGGMGIVYRAKQEYPEREVALKMLLPAFTASVDLRQRFRQEAATLSRLEHPAILPVFATGEYDGFPWFTMKLATGGNLAERMENYRHDWSGIANLLIILAEGLQYAHDHGVLHRDIKPGNVLFDEHDRPHIADFGLAKLADSDSDLTRSSGMLGTPQYLAPEIIEHDARAATIASDLYGLGAILHELLTGRPPFQAPSSGALLQSILEKPPFLESETVEGVPRDLRVICLKCLARNPAERYPTARDLAAELRRFLRGEPIRARPAGPLELTWRWCRRRPAIAALLGISAVLLVTVIAVTVIARVRLGEQERTLRHKDYVADMRMADHAIQEKNIGQAIELLDKWRPAAKQEVLAPGSRAEDLRNFEWGYFQNLCRSDEMALLGRLDDRAYRVAYSPDGKRIASSGANGEVCLWDVASHELIGRGQHQGRVRALAYSPDGRFVASGSDDQRIQLWETGSMKPAGAAFELNSALITLAFSADGKTLATVAKEEFVLWDVTSHAALKRQIISPPTWFYGAISPQLDLIALPTVGANGVELWNLPPTDRRQIGIDLTIAVAFSADGRFLAGGGFGGQLRVWLTSDSGQVMSVAAHEGTVAAVAWSPDGGRLATAGADGSVKLWEFPSGRLLATYQGHLGFVSGVTFSPDGNQFATCSADKTVRLWDATQSPPPHENPAHRLWGKVREYYGTWVTADNLNRETAWIDPKSLQLVPIPAPPAPPDTTNLVKSIDDGFMVFGPGLAVSRFDKSGKPVRGPMPIPPGRLADLVISRDGRWMVFQSETNSPGFTVWRQDAPELPIRLQGTGGGWIGPTFSYDSQYLAAITIGGEVSIWRLPDCRLVRRFKAVPGLSNGLTFSRDGKQFAVSSVDGAVKVWATDNWDQEPAILSTGTKTVWSVNFSPDGKRLAGGGDDGHVFLWDLSTGQLVSKLKASGKGLIYIVGFSKSGRELMAFEFDRGEDPPQLFIWQTQGLPASLEIQPGNSKQAVPAF